LFNLLGFVFFLQTGEEFQPPSVCGSPTPGCGDPEKRGNARERIGQLWNLHQRKDESRSKTAVLVRASPLPAPPAQR